MYAELGLLIAGLLGLWFGSELAVNGAKNIAKHFRISAGFIGLTILSIGTSIPEIAVSIAGGIDRLAGLETSGIVIGNKIGSAANQLTLILGVVALFGVLAVKRRLLLREGLMLIGSIVILALLGFDGFFSVFDGWVLIMIYLLYMFTLSREEKVYEKFKGRRPEMDLWKDILRLVGGLLLVAFASNIVVENGVGLAAALGVTQTFIGIFVIGLGTGLPELAVSLAALKKGEVEMSVGNLVGSNICDLLFSLGVGTIIAGFIVPERILFYDIPALLLISGVAIYLFRQEMKLDKTDGLILIFLYFTYLGLRLYLFG